MTLFRALVNLTVPREICAPPSFVAWSDTQQELFLNDVNLLNRYSYDRAPVSTKRHVGTRHL